jgi:hypothetical protein
VGGSGGPPLTLTPPGATTLPAATAGLPYTTTIKVSGGSGSYAWMLGGSNLPDGLVMTPPIDRGGDGHAGATLTIAGTPPYSSGGGPYAIIISVTDSPNGALCSDSVGGRYSLMIQAPVAPPVYPVAAPLKALDADVNRLDDEWKTLKVPPGNIVPEKLSGVDLTPLFKTFSPPIRIYVPPGDAKRIEHHLEQLGKAERQAAADSAFQQVIREQHETERVQKIDELIRESILNLEPPAVPWEDKRVSTDHADAELAAALKLLAGMG